MTYTYEVGYHSYEESPIYTLTNDKEYTQQQFDELVSDCMIEAYKAKKAKEVYTKSIQDILKETINILKDKFGFKAAEIHARFTPFGWADLDKKDDWKECTKHDEQYHLIQKKLGVI